MFPEQYNAYMAKDFKKIENELYLKEQKIFENKKDTKPSEKIEEKPEKLEISLNKFNKTVLICQECHELVDADKKKIHIKNHHRNRIVECSNCRIKLKRRLLNDHYKICVKNNKMIEF